MSEEDRLRRRQRRKAREDEESRDVLTALVESQKSHTERFASNITSSSSSSIRTRNTFIEVFDEPIELDRIRSKRTHSLPPQLVQPEIADLTSLLFGQLNQSPDNLSVTNATVLDVRGLVGSATRGRVLWFVSCRGFDMGLVKCVDFKGNDRIIITFTDHAAAVAFKLMFELTPGEIPGSLVRVDWYDPPTLKPRQAQQTTLKDKKSRLFVGGLAPETTDESLRALFCSYGELEEASVILDKRTKLSRGFGFIAFKNGYVPPTVLTNDLWLDGKNIGVRVYGSAPEKPPKL